MNCIYYLWYCLVMIDAASSYLHVIHVAGRFVSLFSCHMSLQSKDDWPASLGIVSSLFVSFCFV